MGAKRSAHGHRRCTTPPQRTQPGRASPESGRTACCSYPPASRRAAARAARGTAQTPRRTAERGRAPGHASRPGRPRARAPAAAHTARRSSAAAPARRAPGPAAAASPCAARAARGRACDRARRLRGLCGLSSQQAAGESRDCLDGFRRVADDMQVWCDLSAQASLVYQRAAASETHGACAACVPARCTRATSRRARCAGRQARRGAPDRADKLTGRQAPGVGRQLGRHEHAVALARRAGVLAYEAPQQLLAAPVQPARACAAQARLVAPGALHASHAHDSHTQCTHHRWLCLAQVCVSLQD